MISTDALRFLRLHQRYLVEKYQTLFNGAMVRATTDRGITASVSVDDLEELLSAGLLQPSWGGSFVLTDAGKAYT
jgi:hypothetical protein